MKHYQKKRTINAPAADTTVPVLPAFESCDPTEGRVAARYFDNNGNYLGWTDIDTTRKYVLGKLYYKTKGAYRCKTKRMHNEVGAKKIFIYEKQTSHLAAVIIQNTITSKHLVDLDDKRQLALETLSAIQKHGFTTWNFTEFPNAYGIVSQAHRKKMQDDMQNFLNEKKAELIAICQSQIDTVDTYKAAESDIGWQISNAV